MKAVREDQKFSVEVCEEEEIRELIMKAQSGCIERSVHKLEPEAINQAPCKVKIMRNSTLKHQIMKGKIEK